MRMTFLTHEFKLALVWSVLLLFRLIPFRPPNFEPLLATVMPLSKRMGPVGSFLFAFLGIVIYDLCTSGVGSWTWLTSISYGLLAVSAHYFFANRKASVVSFVGFGVAGTLVYDLVTGVLAGPLLYGQSLAVAFVGQIPFTLMHLVGVGVFSLTISPALDAWFAQDESIEAVPGQVVLS